METGTGTIKKVTHAFGEQRAGLIDRIGHAHGRVETKSTTVVLLGIDGGGYIMIGADHKVKPILGMGAVIEFTAGGPMGGYWRIISMYPHGKMTLEQVRVAFGSTPADQERIREAAARRERKAAKREENARRTAKGKEPAEELQRVY
jgi:hypothetical protein